MSRLGFLSSFKKTISIAVLVLVLFSTWIVISILRLVKTDSWYKTQEARLFGISSAHADIPGDSGGGTPSTPFLSFWDGVKYRLENDLFHGKPRSYFETFKQGFSEFSAGNISPDLYKIQGDIKKDNVLKFRIEEIEPEESFLKRLNLFRILHPRNSVVLVDNNFKRPYIFDKEELMGGLIEPSNVFLQGKSVKGLADSILLFDDKETSFIEKNSFIDIEFENMSEKKSFLLLKSRYRDWVMGEENSLMREARAVLASFIRSGTMGKVSMAVLTSLVIWFLGLTKAMSLSPLLMLVDGSCSSSSSSSGGDSGGDSMCASDPSIKCLIVSYKKGDDYVPFGVIEPRAWRYNLDLIEIPTVAYDNRKLSLRIRATENHEIGFVGMASGVGELEGKREPLSLKKAYHHRLGEMTFCLTQEESDFVHTIPGDVIDLEFESSTKKIGEDEMESYIIEGSGFYTRLTASGKAMAGNWPERISEEGKLRLASLKNK